MWDFLKAALEHGGTAAALYFLTLIGVGVALWSLWRHNQAIQARLVNAEVERERVRKEAAEEHAKRLREIVAAHQDEIRSLVRRLDEVQERRVSESQKVTEKTILHIQHIDRTVEKLGTAVDVLIELSSARRERRGG